MLQGSIQVCIIWQIKRKLLLLIRERLWYKYITHKLLSIACLHTLRHVPTCVPRFLLLFCCGWPHRLQNWRLQQLIIDCKSIVGQFRSRVELYAAIAPKDRLSFRSSRFHPFSVNQTCTASLATGGVTKKFPVGPGTEAALYCGWLPWAPSQVIPYLCKRS